MFALKELTQKATETVPFSLKNGQEEEGEGRVLGEGVREKMGDELKRLVLWGEGGEGERGRRMKTDFFFFFYFFLPFSILLFVFLYTFIYLFIYI